MIRARALLLALMASQCGGPPAYAAGMLCGPRAAMVETLAQEHDERPVARGLDNSGVMVEVFMGPKGNWTIVTTQPNGMACLMAAGEGWETLPVAQEPAI